MTTYLTIYTAAMLTAVLATPAIARLARAWGAVDAPGIRKIHRKAIPRIGGTAIVLAMLVGMIPACVLDGGTSQALRETADRLVVLFATSLLVFLLGFIDDIRGVRARVKLLVQVLAAVVLCLFGIRIEQAALGWRTVELGWFAWPLTVLWVVGITNAVNLIDGLDGLAAGICTVACGVILILSVYSNHVVMAILMLSLLGSLTGFLIFNFNPARVFMGDCGSMFLGFLLAASSVMCATQSQTIVGLALPALALGVPIFDTLFTMLRRILERRGVMSPDHSHLHHKLLDMGLRHRHVVLLLYGLTLLAAGLGMFMMVTRDAGTLVVFACVVLLLLSVFRFVGVVSLRRTVRSLRHNLEIAQQARQDRRQFERSQLRMRRAASFDGWWTAVCAAAKDMDVARIRMRWTERDGASRTLRWKNPAPHAPPGEFVRTTVPVAHRRAGPPLRMEMDVPANGSLESAGRRLALFSRLIDENSLDSLLCRDAAAGSDPKEVPL